MEDGEQATFNLSFGPELAKPVNEINLSGLKPEMFEPEDCAFSDLDDRWYYISFEPKEGVKIPLPEIKNHIISSIRVYFRTSDWKCDTFGIGHQLDTGDGYSYTDYLFPDSVNMKLPPSFITVARRVLTQHCSRRMEDDSDHF